MKLNVLQLKNCPIFRQLQIEEALLRTDQENWCIINEGSPPAIVMGISGKAEELVAPGATLPLIRRFSGGGTVVVDEETLFITFIGVNGLIGSHPTPEAVHRWAEALYCGAIALPGFSLRENDYVFGEHKVGGNAQYFRKERWLHHTSFLWDWNPFHMEQLLHPPKAPAYRLQRSHGAFLSRLKDHLPSRAFLPEALLRYLEGAFSLNHCSLADAEAFLEVPHRRATRNE